MDHSVQIDQVDSLLLVNRGSTRWRLKYRLVFFLLKSYNHLGGFDLLAKCQIYLYSSNITKRRLIASCHFTFTKAKSLTVMIPSQTKTRREYTTVFIGQILTLQGLNEGMLSSFRSSFYVENDGVTLHFFHFRRNLFWIAISMPFVIPYLKKIERIYVRLKGS